MSIYSAPVEVVNAALARMGIKPIQDLSEATKPAITASEVYEGLVRSVLSRHRWSFSMKEEALQYQGATTGKYSAVYALPGDTLSVVNITQAGVLIDYRIQDKQVHCNIAGSSDLRGLIAYRTHEGNWADDFAEAIVTRLQAVFFRALREDEAAALNMEKLSEQHLVMAMVRDKRQSPPTQEMRINGGRLRSAWRGGV